MTRAPVDLGALIGSRLCHDLVSPLGAISNGVELLQMTGAATPELGLVADSVAHANARLRFFRLAFGTAPPTATVRPDEVTGILGDLTAQGRIVFGWRDPAVLPRPEARLLFLLLLCAETALPAGGEVAITRTTDRVEVVAQGPRIAVNGPLWQALGDTEPAIEAGPAEVQFLMAPGAARGLSRRIRLDLGTDRLVLSA